MCKSGYVCISAFLKELSGQQQTSSSESEFDFPQDDSAFAASEFREEGVDSTADNSGSSADAGAHHSAAEGTSHVSGKQSVFEGYKDPSKQFSGNTRSYHQDARYKQSPINWQYKEHNFLASVLSMKVITSVVLHVADISLDTIISTTRV